MAALLAAAGVACSDNGDTASSSPGTDQSAAGSTAPTTTEPGAPDTSEPVPSAGCDSNPPTVDPVLKEKRTLDVDGTERWFLISRPEAEVVEPTPVVVDFHGFLEGADIHSLTSKFGEYGQQEGFIVLGPHGSGEPVQWNTDPSIEANPDLQFVIKMLDTVAAEQCVDLSRVYATGLSMGGFMSSLVACTLSERFAAVAPVAGIRVPEPCTPGRPVPILTFHGTADRILPFNGGSGSLGDILGGEDPATTPTTAPPADLEGEGYPAAVRTWAEMDGCRPDPTDEEISPEVTLRSYSCPPGVAVEFYVVEGGGHSWPGSEFNRSIENIVGYTTFDIDATELSWEFFQRFRLADPVLA